MISRVPAEPRHLWATTGPAPQPAARRDPDGSRAPHLNWGPPHLVEPELLPQPGLAQSYPKTTAAPGGCPYRRPLTCGSRVTKHGSCHRTGALLVTDHGCGPAGGVLEGAGRSDSNRRPPRCCRGALPLCYDPALRGIIAPTHDDGQGITQLPRPPSTLCLPPSKSSSIPARQRRSTPPPLYAACPRVLVVLGDHAAS